MLVSDAVVPMLLWPAVPVVRLVYEDLTVVDRFVVEAALMLTPIRAEDIEEVTDLPRDAVSRIAGRLIGLGLLSADGHDYYPVESKARVALDRRAVPEHRSISLTFLYLPYSDDLVAFAPGLRRPDPPHLHKAKNVKPAPLPPEIAGMTRTMLLRDRILAGRVAGLPAGMEIVDVVDTGSDDQELDWCPAYRCRGHVRFRGQMPTLVLDVIDGDGRLALKCTIPEATGQVAAWEALAQLAATAGATWHAVGGQVIASNDGPATWTYQLDGPAASAAVAERVAVSQPGALLIHDDTNEVAVNATFAPIDQTATLVFALDHAVRAVVDRKPAALEPHAITDAVATARSAYSLADDTLTEVDLIERLWTDGHYGHIYGLRAKRDFGYD